MYIIRVFNHWNDGFFISQMEPILRIVTDPLCALSVNYRTAKKLDGTKLPQWIKKTQIIHISNEGLKVTAEITND